MKLIFVFVFLAASWSSTAVACSCDFPFESNLRTGSGELPENALGVVWEFEPQGSNNESIEVFEVSQGSKELVTHTTGARSSSTLVIKPDGWKDGRMYEINVERNGSVETATVAVGPPLNDLDISVSKSSESIGAVQVTASGSCTEMTTSSYVDVSWTANRFNEILIAEVLVDGTPHYPLGRDFCDRETHRVPTMDDEARLVAICSTEFREGPFAGWGLTEGRHDVVIRGRFAGTEVAFESDPISINLSCTEQGGCSSVPVPNRSLILLLIALGFVNRAGKLPK